MTFEERTIIRAAINQAKRAWLEAEGGYRAVEYDARCMDARIAGRGRGSCDRTRLERARVLRENGMSYVRIGAELGIHHSTVYTWLNKESKQERVARREAKKQKAISLHAQGLTYAQISEQVSVHLATVGRWVTDANSQSTSAVG